MPTNDVWRPGPKTRGAPRLPALVLALLQRDDDHDDSHYDTDRQEAAPMFEARAFALATSDVAFFSLPPVRPSRSTRRPQGGNSVGRGLMRGIRRALERASEEPGQTFLPRITNYPY